MNEYLTEKQAYNYAIKLLCIKDYSRHKINQKLLSKGTSQDTTSKILDILVDQKYLREDFYTEARIKGLARKGKSIRYIKDSLANEHIRVTDDDIHHIFQEAGIDPAEEIKKLIEKKLKSLKTKKSLTDYQIKFKITSFLISKGYFPEEVQDPIREML